MITSQLLLMLAIMLAVLGLPLLLLGAVVRGRIKGFNRRAVPVWGTVVHCQSQVSTAGSFTRRIFVPHVEFATQQGQVIRKTGLGHREPVPLGTPVELLYDPQQPSEVSFTGPRGQAGVATGLWILGWLMVLAALGLGVLAVIA